MKNHPNIDVPAGKLEKVFRFLALFLFLGLFVYVAFVYRSLPEEIPIHFNAKGEADGWGGRAVIFGMPLMALPMFIILFFLGKSPQVHNYPVKVTEENAHQLYRESRLLLAVMNFEVVGIFSLITWEIVQSAKGNFNLGGWMTVLSIAPTLITIAYFMFRMRRLKPTTTDPNDDKIK